MQNGGPNPHPKWKKNFSKDEQRFEAYKKNPIFEEWSILYSIFWPCPS